MSGANEVALGLLWLQSVLSSDATLSGLAPGGVYRAMAPPNTSPIYVIVAYQAGTDALTLNAYRMLSNLIYQVKAVGPVSSTAAIVAASKQIDVLLGGPTSGSVSGGYISACYRDGSLQIDELRASGEQWSNFGGLYRLQVQAM
jgi:hypothetical protein